MEAQDKKQEILKAASACFARYGYEKTTLDDIGRLVGLNKASLYYYFKSKEEIFTGVIHSEAADFIQAVFTEVGKVPGCKQKILVYLEERLKFIRDALNLKQLSAESVNKVAPLINTMYSGILARETEKLSEVLECCIKNKEIAVCDTGRVARSIITVAEGVRNRIDCQLSTETAFREVLDEIKFTVSLMLDGLKLK